MKYDCVVIGSGMAGLTAASYLAERNISTAVVTKGDPVCSISTGCIDIAGTGMLPLETVRELPETHPYRLMDTGTIVSSAGYFMGLMEEAGLPYFGSPEKNRKIITPMGFERVTSLVPGSMKNASPEGEFHLVSFKDLKDFYPGYITRSFPETGVSVFEAGTYTTLGIASLMDREDFLEGFIGWIKNRNIRQERIGVPAVLGITKTEKIMKRLEAETGKRWFEIPTIPPSIPGLRLYNALKGAALKRGASYYGAAEISGVKDRNGVVESLELGKPGRPDIVEGKTFLLATGSFVSGGLYSEKGKIRESVFDLPVSVPKDTELFNHDFFQPGHPVEKSGIKTGRDFRPVESELRNVFAAGSILAGSETMKYQCGHGMAAATGIAAAEAVREYLG